MHVRTHKTVKQKSILLIHHDCGGGRKSCVLSKPPSTNPPQSHIFSKYHITPTPFSNMLNAGTVRKRVRRTLVKVHGLGVIPYDEAEDKFNINSLFKAPASACGHGDLSGTPTSRPPSTTHSGNFDRNRAQSRVTRDPLFHMEEGRSSTGSDDEFEDYHNGGGGSIAPQPENTSTDALVRPYLLNKLAIRMLRAIVFVGMMAGSLPWRWNNRSHRVDSWSPKLVSLWRLYTIATALQSFCIMSYHFYFFVIMFYHVEGSYRGVFAYFFYIYWYAYSFAYKITAYVYQEAMREYINTLFKFNNVYVERYLLHVDSEIDRGQGQMILKLALPSSFIQIVNLFLFFVLMPERPEYFTSKLLPKPWYWLVPGALQDISMSAHHVVFYILGAWIVVAHTNSIGFWLREIHKGNESGFTRNTMRSSSIALETYRTLQILNTCFNNCVAPQLLPNMKGVVFIGVIACVFMFIRSLGQVFIDEFPGVLAYPFGAINASVIGFGCLSMGAEMYDIANSFIDSWSRTKQKDFRRVLLSCPSLKMMVVRFYFVTTATTITFFQSITSYLTDFLISFPS